MVIKFGLYAADPGRAGDDSGTFLRKRSAGGARRAYLELQEKEITREASIRRAWESPGSRAEHGGGCERTKTGNRSGLSLVSLYSQQVDGWPIKADLLEHLLIGKTRI